MRSSFARTFGGLSCSVYVRHFLFGSVVAALMIAIALSGTKVNYGVVVFALISTLLYPYSRFVYESVASYVQGGNTFYWEAGAFLYVKCVTIVICWAFAIFVAPIGLIYLFIQNARGAAR